MGPGMARGLHWHVKPVCLTGGVWPCLEKQRKTWDDMTLSYPWDGNGNRLEIPNVKWKHLHIFKVWTRKMFSGLEVAAPMQKKNSYFPSYWLFINRAPYFMVYFFPPQNWVVSRPLDTLNDQAGEFYNFTNLVVSSTPKWTRRASPTPENRFSW